MKRKEKNAKKSLDNVDADLNESLNETSLLEQQLAALSSDLELKSRKKRPMSSSLPNQDQIEEKKKKMQEKQEKEEKDLQSSLSKEMDDIKKKTTYVFFFA